jgi:general secretion pathway protein K
MNLRPNTRARGVALILVMVVIVVLGVMAGGFAYSMKVEMKLARNHVDNDEMDWLGRSGVELARYILGQQLGIPIEPFDALNQKWAGGLGVTNEIMAAIAMDNYPLGAGSLTLKIVDCERKANINTADQRLLQQAFNLLGVDVVDFSTAIDSLFDWMDPDELTRMKGAESDYYLGLNPPYAAKNGPIDDLSELLLIQGITPEMYWGTAGSNELQRVVSPPVASASSDRLGFAQSPTFAGGLVDLFTPISNGQININTASSAVLQLIPGIDANTAEQIIRMRAGPDGAEGNEDDTPFRVPGELVNVPGMNRQFASLLARYCTVRSSTFEVQVDARIGQYTRHYKALLRRNTPRDVQILSFYWE